MLSWICLTAMEMDQICNTDVSSFNPCCRGSVSLPLPILRHKRVISRFQSLLSWICLTAESQMKRLGRVGRVSILVVVDLSHCPRDRFHLSADDFWFQSLLSWICLTACFESVSSSDHPTCFNPCCRGSVSLPVSDSPSWVARVSVSILVVVDLSHCLGIRSRSISTMVVSILVVVDLSHCQFWLMPMLNLLHCFNPCCRGSVSLPGLLHQLHRLHMLVLILVVVDLSHCPSVVPNFLNQINRFQSLLSWICLTADDRAWLTAAPGTFQSLLSWICLTASS